MANKFELSEHARQELKEIWTYLAENNYDAADRALRELGQKFQLLANNPLLGRAQDDLILNLRRFPYEKIQYLLFSGRKRNRNLPRASRVEKHRRAF